MWKPNNFNKPVSHIDTFCINRLFGNIVFYNPERDADSVPIQSLPGFRIHVHQRNFEKRLTILFVVD